MAVKSFLARSVWAGNLGVCKRICSLMAQRGMKTQVLTMWRSRTVLRPVMHRTLKLKCCTLYPYAVILCMYDEDEDTDIAFCTDYQLTVIRTIPRDCTGIGWDVHGRYGWRSSQPKRHFGIIQPGYPSIGIIPWTVQLKLYPTAQQRYEVSIGPQRHMTRKSCRTMIRGVYLSSQEPGICLRINMANY